MKFDKEADEVLGIDMTPLVDAIFAIILFLVATSSMVESLEQDISINLPTQGKAIKTAAPPTPPIVVNVRYLPGGKVYYHIENSPVTLGQLTPLFSKRKVTNKDQGVVIRGDKNVKWDNIAAVMAKCAEAGITKVSATVEVHEDTAN